MTRKLLILFLLVSCQTDKADKPVTSAYVERLKTDIYDEIDSLKRDMNKLKKSFKKRKKTDVKPQDSSDLFEENGK
jgi:hypothetical protein